MNNLRFLTNSLIAHRGLHDIEKGIPENSIEAFKQALEKGYMIELDVHITKDRQVIVFHDDNLLRMCGIDRKIKYMTYEEIKQYKLQNTESYIQTIEEVLKLINGEVPILIELKYDNKVGILEKELIKILDKYDGKYAIQSFNPFSVLWFKLHRRNIIRGQLVSKYTNTKMNMVKKFFLSHMLLNFLTKPHFISYDVHNTEIKEVEKMRRKRIVLGWTVKTTNDYDKYFKYYDNLICEKFI